MPLLVLPPKIRCPAASVEFWLLDLNHSLSMRAANSLQLLELENNSIVFLLNFCPHTYMAGNLLADTAS